MLDKMYTVCELVDYYKVVVLKKIANGSLGMLILVKRAVNSSQ